MLTLREQDREKVIEIIRRHVSDVDILAYGSRVNGDCHDGSDLDLAIRARDRQPLPIRALSQIVEDLRDSNIPILVEVRDWARLPASFQTDIERKHEMI
jgi:uncharacterized protein